MLTRWVGKHHRYCNDFMVADNPSGWKVVLTHRVPALAAAAVPPTFESLIGSIPSLQTSIAKPITATDFDWALHPGGSTIITGVQSVMNLTEDHLRASYEIYMNYGNSSSATIMAVMNRLRNMGEGKENVIACAFGPGIALEMMILKRKSNVSLNCQGIDSGDAEENVLTQNGHATTKDNRTENGHVATNGNGLDSIHDMASDLPVPDID